MAFLVGESVASGWIQVNEIKLIDGVADPAVLQLIIEIASMTKKSGNKYLNSLCLLQVFLFRLITTFISQTQQGDITLGQRETFNEFSRHLGFMFPTGDNLEVIWVLSSHLV